MVNEAMATDVSEVEYYPQNSSFRYCAGSRLYLVCCSMEPIGHIALRWKIMKSDKQSVSE